MVFRRGRFQPRYGVEAFGSDLGAKVIGMASFGPTIGWGSAASTGDRLVAGATNGWYRYNAGAWTLITGSGLSSSNHIIFRVFHKNNSNYLIGINNGVDAPLAWDGVVADAAAAISGNPPKPKAMMVLANRLLLFNLATNTGYTGVVSPVGVDVSAFNDFNSGWSTTLNGLLSDTPGDIIGALEMGDLQGAIYKSDAIVMAIAQGGNIPFHFEWRIIGGTGPCNSRCIVPLQDGSHVYLGTDGAVYRFNGMSVQSLGVHIQKQVLYSADQDLSNLVAKAWGFYNRTMNEVTFFYKGSGVGVISAIVVNMDNLSVWPLSYSLATASDVTAGGLQQVPSDSKTRVVLFAGTSGKNYREADAVMSDEGSAFVKTWSTGIYDMGAPGVFKTLTESDHLLDAGTDDPAYAASGGAQDILTQVTIMSDEGNAPATVSGSNQTISISNTAGAQKILDHRATALMFGMNFIVSTGSTMFEHRGVTLRAAVRGRR